MIHNKLGAKSYAKYLKEIFGKVLSESKNRCKVYRVQKSTDAPEETLKEWLDLGELKEIEGSELRTYPGTFSRKKIDPGSRLLAEHLPYRMKGEGADLGAGYGYLSHEVLKKDYPITALHLYESEYRALEAAKANLAELIPDGLEVSYQWQDVTAGIQHQKLDWIVMNPPFHLGKTADVTIGESFVQVAAKALRRKGQLWMVANRHLPYEKILETDFASYEILADAEGYKVFRARK